LFNLIYVISNELTNVNKKLNIVTAKLDEALRQKEEGERSREKLRVEITNLNDNVSSIRYELVVQRGRTQETQFLLDSANILLDEKDAKMHKLVKERNDLVVESNALSKTIETLEGQYL